MTDYTTYGGVYYPEVKRPICEECNKEIWGISHIKFTLGVEKPVLLHAVCYERLLENAGKEIKC